jgi:glycine/D-amino acid oxidase-like deaminating enzyme
MTFPQSVSGGLPAPRSTPYGRLRAAPFDSDAQLPSDAPVVIIGGGILGVMTAWCLARRGVPALLCEKAEIACESSSRAFGWVTELLSAPLKLALAQASKRLWRELQAEGEFGYREDGVAYLADSEEELGHFEAWLDSVRGIGDARSCLLDADAVAQRYPGAARRYAGALLAPSDGSIEPVITTAAVAEAARRLGARIVTGCAVRGLDVQAGRVAGVYTEKGYVRTASVLCAANTWSRLFCGNHGIDVPQLYAVFSMGRTDPLDSAPLGGGGQ